MPARLSYSEHLGDIRRILPICTEGASDSATFDEVVELLHMAGRSLPHSVLMMIPEAWENHDEMDPDRRAFYQFHANLMEPWDGPANVCSTDGCVIGAVLDRNGLRPGRFWVTDEGLVVLGSEAGVLDIDPATVVRKGRLQPGRMFLVDTVAGRIIEDDEIKAELAAQAPYADWLRAGIVHLEELPEREHVVHTSSRRRAASRRSGTPRRNCGSCSPPWRATAWRRWAPWAPIPRSLCCQTGPDCCSTTSSSSSPR